MDDCPTAHENAYFEEATGRNYCPDCDRYISDCLYSFDETDDDMP